MLITLFKLAFIEARAVGSATQALSLSQSEHFDLYVLDAWLPASDGFELCRRMRALHPPTPIIFFSGAAHAADKQKGIDAGADAYIIKPDIDELVTRVKQFVSGDVPKPASQGAARWELPPVVPEIRTSTPARGLKHASPAKLPISSIPMCVQAEGAPKTGPAAMAMAASRHST